jgi:phosphatidylglycerol:prolipoprotein diacylglycerol transferase
VHWTGRVDPIALEIGPFSIAWYGLIITVAMLIGLIFCMYRIKRIGLASDDAVEVFLFSIPFAVLGGRLGYVFSHSEQFFVSNFGFADFINIFAVWQGGITILTAVPFAVLGYFIWSRWRKVEFFSVADLTLPIVLLCQALGRWGNFFNHEIYGAVITNPSAHWFPLAVFIPHTGNFHQATFFYESVLNIVFFVILFYTTNRLKVKGAGTIGYFMCYSLIRFIMEFMRVDYYNSAFNYTQLICAIVFVLLSALLAWLIYYKVKVKRERVWYKNRIPEELFEKQTKKVAAKS